MRNLISRPYRPNVPLMSVNIEPCWFSGSQAEVLRKYNDFKEILEDEDNDMTVKINDAKHRGSISDSGYYFCSKRKTY